MELLVVIGIIALLIAMLLPVLRRAKESAMRTICMSNHKQLMTAVIMYATENKNLLPFCNWGAGDLNPPPGHPGWLFWERYRTTSGGGNATQNYVESDVETGVLWKYLHNRKVYRCPLQDTNGVIYQASTNILTSYNMNGAVFGYGQGRPQGPGLPGWKISKMVKFRSDGVCFWETREDIAFAWNDGSNYPQDQEGLTKRHGAGGSVISCFDGHAEFMTFKEFTAQYNKRPGRLWCNPGKPTGD